MQASELSKTIEALRMAGNDSQQIEVKEAVRGLPKTMGESITALANGSGGLVILGLSEKQGFIPAPGFDARASADAIARLCSDDIVPPIRANIEQVAFEGAQVVIAVIPELPPAEKPCCLGSKGMYRGSFIRTGDGDRLLTQYEIDRLVEERAQPHHDLEIVEGATLSDLDENLVSGMLQRQRSLHPRIFGRLSDEDALRALNVLARRDGKDGITLAGLLALGTYPQHFYPRLTVTFACFPGKDKAPRDGIKFLDSESMAGPIPAVLMDTVAAAGRNMRRGGVLKNGLRYDLADYPLDAVHEAVCNALMHRDYSTMGRGSQVQVNMYEDRLEVLSPGGLFGAVTVNTIGEVGSSSTRNPALAALLETTPYENGGFVAENRGTGYALIEAELASHDMPKAEVIDRPSLFQIVLRRSESENQKTCQAAPASSRMVRTNKSEDAVISALEELGDARTSEIAEHSGLPRSTASRALKQLMQKGLVAVSPGATTNPTRRYTLTI